MASESPSRTGHGAGRPWRYWMTWFSMVSFVRSMALRPCLPGLHLTAGGRLAAHGRRSLDFRSRTASALRMSRREMLGERQVAAPLMAQRAAHGALRLAHRRFQPRQGVGIQPAGLRLSGKPQRPSQCQFGHETLVLAFALFAPAASLPGQHCAVRRQRGRQVAPRGHASTVGQRFLRLVPRDDQQGAAQNISPREGAGNPSSASVRRPARRPRGQWRGCPARPRSAPGRSWPPRTAGSARRRRYTRS